MAFASEKKKNSFSEIKFTLYREQYLQDFETK